MKKQTEKVWVVAVKCSDDPDMWSVLEIFHHGRYFDASNKAAQIRSLNGGTTNWKTASVVGGRVEFDAPMPKLKQHVKF